MNMRAGQPARHLREEDGQFDDGVPLRPHKRLLTPGSRSRRGGKKDAGPIGQATWISSVINLLNTILGAGLLAMPHALAQMGIFLGIFVVAWAGLTAGFGLYLQSRCARYVERGASSFAALAKLTYPNAAVVFDGAIALKCFGVGVSYLIIIGDLMPGVVKGFSEKAAETAFLVDRQFWITAFMLIVIPLAFLRRLDSLKYTSIIALISIAYLVLLILVHFIKGDTLEDRGEVRVFRWAGPVSALAAFPVIVFAYTCHQNMFSILNEIFDNSQSRTTAVVVASIGSACMLYILCGITGYLSYGDNVSGNIVQMYPHSPASTFGRAAIVVLVMFSYPLQVHPCRASVDAVINWRPQRNRGSSADPSPSRTGLLTPNSTSPSPPQRTALFQPKREMSDIRFAIITTIIIVLSYVVAMTVTSLEKVLAYVGSTGSTTISFILPGLFYYKISDPESPHHQKLMKEDDDEAGYDAEDLESSGFLQAITDVKMRRHWRRTLLRKASLGLAIYGFFVMVVCLGTNTFLVAAH
ncbi:vacuolar amino acid transporter-like protein 6 [Pseudovirgaria hyperparasitica]|uniref:Vacuolar amino acid transporter-like protein 6 n=1 Tax=Pseudovirgaria hyperparasitica TaxID=470096 RepID=A0A6A6W9R9_9PEZI|nr:vacuolar amino acid transporter-like protein 6 [Pseudovirgaria hyperparasitica]KAF2758337.1 vacuolar amino acid transporter-like protein 6 [Pseudovirgaria hyperparasitica]